MPPPPTTVSEPPVNPFWIVTPLRLATASKLTRNPRAAGKLPQQVAPPAPPASIIVTAEPAPAIVTLPVTHNADMFSVRTAGLPTSLYEQAGVALSVYFPA